MFLPLRVQELLNSDGLLRSQDQAAYTSQIAAYMGAVNVLGLRKCVVVSRKTGEVRPIRSIEIGSVIDTQRRRRNGIVESRVSTNVSQV